MKCRQQGQNITNTRLRKTIIPAHVLRHCNSLGNRVGARGGGRMPESKGTSSPGEGWYALHSQEPTCGGFDTSFINDFFYFSSERFRIRICIEGTDFVVFQSLKFRSPKMRKSSHPKIWKVKLKTNRKSCVTTFGYFSYRWRFSLL